MNGRVCLITGATNGIGKETALALAKMGANVVLVARSAAKGDATLAEIKQRSANDQVELLLADLASLDATRRLAAAFREKHDRLHVLVNNAGSYQASRSISADRFEMTFAVNHLAHFLLTDLLLDLLKASAPARVINVSSGAHARATIDFDDLQNERGYAGMSVYGQSKLANVLFTYELARRLEGTGVTANCLHPGVVRTGFGRNNSGIRGSFFAVFHALARPFLLTPEQGAETSIYLAAAPEVETVTGKYFVKKEPVDSSAASYDSEAALRLWQVSAELVK